MADIGLSLRIKFGLRTDPSQVQQDRWISVTQTLISAGTDAEVAGKQAAQQLFTDYRTHVWASEADTITSLLGRAKEKP